MEQQVVRAYHENGVVRSELTEVDGMPHGVTRHWHPNGVLAQEIPVRQGIIDGVVKQWNDKGKLLGKSELKAGTGIYRMWHPNGLLHGEISYVHGQMTGPMRVYYEDGELIEESYWLQNKKVSKRRYMAACSKNPDLPRYHPGPSAPKAARSSRAAAKRTTPSYDTGDLPRALLAGPRVREASGWLQESTEPSRTLGESMGIDESLALVKKLYQFGALSVHAVEIDGGPSEDQNTGRLVIELPPEAPKRRRILQLCGTIARQLGFDPEPDHGQQHVLLMLD